MAFGYVRDFIQFEYFGLTIFGSTSFAIFNIADAALCVGVAMFAIYYIFIYKEPKKDEKKEENAAEYSALDDDTVPNENVVTDENAPTKKETAQISHDAKNVSIEPSNNDESVDKDEKDV